MKQKLKKIYQLLAFCILIAFYGCQEDFNSEQNNAQNLKVKEIAFSKAKEIKKFDNAITKVFDDMKTQKSNNKSTVPVEDNSFTIDQSVNVKVISYENSTTYSMLIKREVENNDYFENLVLKTDPTGQTKAYISKYTPSEVARYVASHDSYSFKGDFEIHEIIYNPANSQSLFNIDGCGLILLCDYGGQTHNAGENCGNTYIMMGLCLTDNAGGGGGGIITSPTGGGATTATLADPCDNLKRKLDPTKANLKPTIVALQRTLNQTGENGASLKRDDPNTFLTPELRTATAGMTISFPSGENIYGSIHTHPYGGSPMFSFADVYSLYQFYQFASTTNLPDITVMLVVEYSPGVFQTYALTIEEPDVFLEALIQDLNSVTDTVILEDKILALDNRLVKKYNGTTEYEKIFLQKFEGYGISLFKANSPTLTNWSKLSLSDSDIIPRSVKPTPCN